jgi:hypothetical protein
MTAINKQLQSTRIVTHWSTKVCATVMPGINAFLRPLGLILWVTYWSDEEDAHGLPIGLRVTGLRISRRPPDLDRAVYNALHKAPEDERS